MPRNSASLGSPNAIVAAPNTARIALKTVNVFATAIDRYERLDDSFRCGPRSRSRRSASAAVRPALDAAACTVPVTPRQAR
jgi:hypothetical protein